MNTDGKEIRWFEHIFYGSEGGPMLLGVEDYAEPKNSQFPHLPAYHYVVVDQELLEQNTLYRSDSKDLRLLNMSSFICLHTDRLHVRLVRHHTYINFTHMEGQHTLCIVYTDSLVQTKVLLYDGDHGDFIYLNASLQQNPIHKDPLYTARIAGHIWGILDRDGKTTARQMCEKLVTVMGDDTVWTIYTYDTERDWAPSRYSSVTTGNLATFMSLLPVTKQHKEEQ
jgi:hypothetical protein